MHLSAADRKRNFRAARYGWLVFARAEPPESFAMSRGKSGIWYRRFPRGAKKEAKQICDLLALHIGDANCWVTRKCNAKPVSKLGEQNAKKIAWLDKRRRELSIEDHERFSELKAAFSPNPNALPLSNTIPLPPTKSTVRSAGTNTRLPR